MKSGTESGDNYLVLRCNVNFHFTSSTHLRRETRIPQKIRRGFEGKEIRLVCEYESSPLSLSHDRECRLLADNYRVVVTMLI